MNPHPIDFVLPDLDPRINLSVEEFPGGSFLRHHIIITASFNQDFVENEDIAQLIRDVYQLPIAVRSAIDEVGDRLDARPIARARIVLSVDGHDNQPQVERRGRAITNWRTFSGMDMYDTFKVHSMRPSIYIHKQALTE